MKMPMDRGSMMNPMDKKAKLGVLGRLKDEASKAMGDRLKGMKKVTVAAGSNGDLKKGLDKAKELIEGSPEEEAMESPAEESAEDMAGEGDSEDMSPEDAESEEKSPEEMSPEELQAKIEELMAIKKMKESAGSSSDSEE